VIEALGMTFGVEGDLQRALRANIEQLEPSSKIIDDGKERTVPSGRIDITAMDQSGTTVIIELKSGTANRDAIGQILSYLGDLSREPTRPRGILVAEDFSPAAVSAALAVPNIVLVR
jgi:RecB family endonuclease NucS